MGDYFLVQIKIVNHFLQNRFNVNNLNVITLHEIARQSNIQLPQKNNPMFNCGDMLKLRIHFTYI